MDFSFSNKKRAVVGRLDVDVFFVKYCKEIINFYGR